MNIELAILNSLAASKIALPLPAIAIAAADYLNREPSHMDVNLALKRLQKDGLVKGTEKTLVGMVWKETEEGRLAL